MRTQELARLAGVTVRTLRHYHQIGLLAEPERSVNGYRSYTVADLATVVRIASFTRLGIPLAEVGRVIDDPAAAAALLDRLEEHTTAEIEQLTARQATIAALRRGGAAPDLAPALVPYAALLGAGSAGTVATRRQEREQLALVQHLSGGVAVPWLVRVLEHVSRAAPRYTAAVDALTDLPASASEAEIVALVAELVEVIGPAISPDDLPPLSPEAATLVLNHQDTTSNEAQRQVLHRLGLALTAGSEPPTPEPPTPEPPTPEPPTPGG